MKANTPSSDRCRWCGAYVSNVHRPSVAAKHEQTPGCQAGQRAQEARGRGMVSLGPSSASLTLQVAFKIALPTECIADGWRPGNWGRSGRSTTSWYAPVWYARLLLGVDAVLDQAWNRSPAYVAGGQRASLRKLTETLLVALITPAVTDLDHRAMLDSVAALGGPKAIITLAKEKHRELHAIRRTRTGRRRSQKEEPAGGVSALQCGGVEGLPQEPPEAP